MCQTPRLPNPVRRGLKTGPTLVTHRPEPCRGSNQSRRFCMANHRQRFFRTFGLEGRRRPRCSARGAPRPMNPSRGPPREVCSPCRPRTPGKLPRLRGYVASSPAAMQGQKPIAMGAKNEVRPIAARQPLVQRRFDRIEPHVGAGSVADLVVDAAELRLARRKGLDDGWIELSLGLKDAVHCLFVGHGRFVETLAAQGIVDVGQGNHPRQAGWLRRPGGRDTPGRHSARGGGGR